MDLPTLTSREIAEACGIYHTQVARYARRLGLKPVEHTRFRTAWPAGLVTAIKAHRATGGRRSGVVTTDLRVEAGHLVVAAVRSDGVRRVLARVPLNAKVKAFISAVID